MRKRISVQFYEDDMLSFLRKSLDILWSIHLGEKWGALEHCNMVGVSDWHLRSPCCCKLGTSKSSSCKVSSSFEALFPYFPPLSIIFFLYPIYFFNPMHNYPSPEPIPATTHLCPFQASMGAQSPISTQTPALVQAVPALVQPF